MAIHFSPEELANRRERTCHAMRADGLDALLIFRQESMYYLTGYDTFGYCFFQCLVLTADGTMTLLTRSADIRQAQNTSVIEDIRVWIDHPDAEPAETLRDILREHGLEGKKLGVEYDSYGLTAANGKRLDAAMSGFCSLTDASLLVTKLRVVKSEAEIAYVRRAAELADDAWDAAWNVAEPGVSESAVFEAMQGAVFRGGGDYPGNPYIIGSGKDALLCRTKTGRRDLTANDQLNIEWAGTYRMYHKAMFRTIVFGELPDRQKKMFDVAHEALLAVEDALRPGNTYGDGFQAHADVIDKAGMQEHRLNACGYSLGTTYAPIWMDWPMMYADNPVVVEPGMVVFCHMIIFDSENTLAMCLGETVLTTDGAPERLSRTPLALPHKP